MARGTNPFRNFIARRLSFVARRRIMDKGDFDCFLSSTDMSRLQGLKTLLVRRGDTVRSRALVRLQHFVIALLEPE